MQKAPTNHLMDIERPYGIYLFKKEQSDHHVLKDLLQLVKSISPGKNCNFAYVEAQTSLIPDLTLWENLQLEAGASSWQEVASSAAPELQQLMRLLPDHGKMAKESAPWEKFSVSLMKGIMMSSHNLLVDMNEDLLSPLMIQNFKKILLAISPVKNIFLASAKASLWLDCGHSLVTRKQYEFNIQPLDHALVRKHWAA
jgi:ABC-type branched-subunit amino acid transport system ATPase component